jgi:hypothetical protein
LSLKLERQAIPFALQIFPPPGQRTVAKYYFNLLKPFAQHPTASVIRAMIQAVDLMMEAVSVSETSVNFYQTTRRIISEDSHLHTRRRENLKSHYLTKLTVKYWYYPNMNMTD